MLGTNDFQTCFDRPAKAVAASLDGYVGDIATYAVDRRGRMPATVLLSPIPIDDTTPRFPQLTGDSFDRTSALRSRELPGEIRRVAEARGVIFADAAEAALPGADGLHLAADSHAPLASYLATVVREAAGRAVG